MPELLEPVADRLPWTGPIISPKELPRLEIEHQGEGRARLMAASWGAEPQLTPQIMPSEVTQANIVHIAALSTAGRQLDFLKMLNQRSTLNGRRSLISIGTYARLVYGDSKRVRQLCALADLFFMNENEANGLFGQVERARTRPGALLFVTLDAAGALVIEGEQVSHVPGHPATAVDPTGAGDTFCGATLAGLTQGRSPVAAAEQAVKLAARMIGAVGPEALLTA
jgi:sugar/nucleoside kinase (ribokinase family)